MFNVQVKESLIPSAGVGVFATVDIPAKTEVCWYWGVILDQAQKEQAFPRGCDPTLTDRVMALPVKHFQRGQLFIDGDRSRCVAGFINHASTPEHMNVEFAIGDEWITEACQIRHDYIRIVTLRNIQSGEELYADYGEQYWMEDGRVADPLMPPPREEKHCQVQENDVQ
jgi:SET domain-containing protein